jgi:hypothetical protein
VVKLIDYHLEDALYQLRQAEMGCHYLVVYPNTPTLRKIYSSYTKSQLEDNNELVVILPYYETTYAVRSILSQTIDVRKCVKEGSLLIIDSLQAYFYSGLGLTSFAKRLVEHAINSGMSGVSILADMGSFYLFNNDINNNNNTHSLLLEYESSLPLRFKDIKLKGFCLYHQEDFDNRFIVSEKEELLEHHYKNLMVNIQSQLLPP